MTSAGSFRLALERAPAGAQLYGAAEDGVTTREIAETVGLDLFSAGVTPEQAVDHFRAFAQMMMLELPPMSDPRTRELLEWQPTHPGVISDLDQGHYFSIGA